MKFKKLEWKEHLKGKELEIYDANFIGDSLEICLHKHSGLVTELRWETCEATILYLEGNHIEEFKIEAQILIENILKDWICK